MARYAKDLIFGNVKSYREHFSFLSNNFQFNELPRKTGIVVGFERICGMCIKSMLNSREWDGD